MDIFKKYFTDKLAKPLHHYTTLKDFLGIVNDAELWATNIFYMNDQSELKRAIKLLQDELAPRIAALKEERDKSKQTNAFLTDYSLSLIKIKS